MYVSQISELVSECVSEAFQACIVFHVEQRNCCISDSHPPQLFNVTKYLPRSADLCKAAILAQFLALNQCYFPFL